MIIADVKAWADKRLATHRELLEGLNNSPEKTIELRGRIAELKELLVALENRVPPVWTDASEL